MSRIAKNTLTIEPDPKNPGSFRMFGYVLGEKIRRRSADVSELETLREELLKPALEAAEERPQQGRLTWLSADQVKEAEGLFHEFRNAPRSLGEYARAGLGALGGTGERVLAEFAIEKWKADMETEQGLYPASINSNVATAEQFVAYSKVKYLDEISPAQIETFGSMERIRPKKGKKPSLYTKIGKLARVRAWLSFCVARRLLAKSPFQIEMDKLQDQARKQKQRPRILTPAQAEILLRTAVDQNPRFVPYIILTTWCFMRHQETQRLTPAACRFGNKVPIIHFTEARKTGARPRTIEIPANVLPLLKWSVDAGLWAKDSAPYFGETAWTTLRDAAGLIVRGEPNAMGYRKINAEQSLWQENILRHTGISYLYQKTGDIAETTRQAGNSDEVAFEFYIHLPEEGDAEHFYAINVAPPAEAGPPAHLEAVA